MLGVMCFVNNQRAKALSYKLDGKRRKLKKPTAEPLLVPSIAGWAPWEAGSNGNSRRPGTASSAKKGSAQAAGEYGSAVSKAASADPLGNSEARMGFRIVPLARTSCRQTVGCLRKEASVQLKGL